MTSQISPADPLDPAEVVGANVARNLPSHAPQQILTQLQGIDTRNNPQSIWLDHLSMWIEWLFIQHMIHTFEIGRGICRTNSTLIPKDPRPTEIYCGSFGQSIHFNSAWICIAIRPMITLFSISLHDSPWGDHWGQKFTYLHSCFI